MLQLSEILSRKIAVTTYGNYWFPKTHDMLQSYLEVLTNKPEFQEYLKLDEVNMNVKEWITLNQQQVAKLNSSIEYAHTEVDLNLKVGKVPYMFNATEIFEMEVENLKKKLMDNGGGENTVFDCQEILSDLFNENNIFLTQPYEDNFYMLDGDEKVNELLEALMDDDGKDTHLAPQFKDISVVVRQFDLDRPIENDQHRWWVVKDNLTKDPAFKNVTPRELFNHPDYDEEFDGDNGNYKNFVLDMPSMPYIADDVKPKYVQFIDIFGRRMCCDDPTCTASGAITWINNIQICLDNYGRPYAMVSFHDNRRDTKEPTIYNADWNQRQNSMSCSSWGMLGVVDTVLEGYPEEEGEYIEEWRHSKKNAEAETVHLYLSNTLITHAVIGGLFRVTQWLNGDNGDIFVKEDVAVDRAERKRIKRSNMGQNTENDEPTVTIKTLKVKPSLYVVEPDGTERKLKASELAQHTRRGHFAHYGINGKGKLFGKYVKSVYRKPTTIGKIENGLVIKDYELEGASDSE